VLLGAATGRDGIGGASILASASFDEESGAKRPSVQIGDPFEEKKLIEACLELYERGLVVGIQDLGAAGISCATSETAAGGGMGMDVDLSKVHLREHDMTPGEILMSESQERMLAIVEPTDVDEVLRLSEKWEVQASVIGTVTTGGTLKVYQHGELVAEIPAASLSEDAPLYRRPQAQPDYIEQVWNSGPPLPENLDVPATLLRLLDDPALADRSWIYSQYDHQLFLNTVIEPGHDGSLLRIKGTRKGLAVSTDGDSKRCYLDPRRGAARIVYEAALNVAVTGARPFAVVDNLNFGNPEKLGVMWQFVETVEGMSAACEALGVPVVGGNVSFYNETDGTDIYPTPVVGMLGFADPMPHAPARLDRAADGMAVWLIGPDDADDFAGSAFDKIIMGRVAGRPAPVDDLVGPIIIDTAARLADDESSVVTVHDVGYGGLAVALAEIAIASEVGMAVEIGGWRELFAEGPHRIVAVTPGDASPVPDGIPARRIATMGGDALDFGPLGSLSLGLVAETWRSALPRRMAH
jgi:phosphoribosylformylglycinamidine synthase